MSKKNIMAKLHPRHPGSKKAERYIQPSLLLGLKRHPSYGYELIHSLQEFGFIEGAAPPGMIYRHLRELESDGLVLSQWETAGTGPAKRIYRITAEGESVLSLWIDYMEKQAGNLANFIRIYRQLT
jgi:poly-beta-hydroxybutyrate-responsive repressor